MQDVVTSVQRVSDIMAEISAASTEQSAGIEQVNQAIAQMDETTQQNAALVEESAAAAGSLQDQAAKLAHAVDVFKVERQAALAPAAPSRIEPAASLPAVRPQPARAAAAKRPAATATVGDGWEEF